MSKNNRKKKEKIKYIDDGRTIADMSGTSRSNPLLGNSSLSSPRGKRRASAKEAWRTYWAAVKTMFLPMLVVMMIITAAFLIVALMFR